MERHLLLVLAEQEQHLHLLGLPLLTLAVEEAVQILIAY
jgi:hypothetical protein